MKLSDEELRGQWLDALRQAGWGTESSMISGEFRLVHRVSGVAITKPEQVEAWYWEWRKRSVTPVPF